MKQFLTVDGKRVEVNVFGSAPQSIVLLSGWTHDFQYEGEFVDELAKVYTVVTISWSGYAQSAVNNKAQHMAFLAQIVREVITQLSLKVKAILGYSMGTHTAVEYLKLFSPNCKTLLLSPPLHVSPGNLPWYGTLLVKHSIIRNLVRQIPVFRQYIVDAAYSQIAHVTEGKKGKNTGFHSDRVTTIGAYDTLLALLSSKLQLIDYAGKVSFIFGEKEVSQRVLLQKNLPFTVIAGVGHNPFKSKSIDVANVVLSLIR